MLRLFYRLAMDRSGSVAAEYGLIIALVALVMAAGATVLGSDLSSLFSGIGGKLATYTPA